MTAGYSGTPLARKLSLKPGMRVWRDGMPASVAAEIGMDRDLTLLTAPDAPIDAAHIFVTERARLAAELPRLMPLLAPHGFIWVSWPKKAANVPTDISEDGIRDVCLSMGLVDVKVCAVDAVWSGLELMMRKARL